MIQNDIDDPVLMTWATGLATPDLVSPIVDEDEAKILAPAPNAIEWCVGNGWCNTPSVYQHARQYQMIRDFFELRCPLCNPGGTRRGEPGDCMPDGRPRSRTYLESEALLVWKQDYEEDVCPKCGNTRSEFVDDGLLTNYNQLHLVVGQRAGKSVAAALIASYVEHRILTIAHRERDGLHGYFGVIEGDVFEMSLVAATDVQSADTIWAKYAGLRAESPWFKKYIPWLKKQETEQGGAAGMKRWSYRETDKRILNEHPRARLIINSLNSNAPGLRGRTRIAAFADEISHMNQTDSTHSATEIYRALERSLRTVRSRVKSHGALPWLGTMVSVTSPVSRDDKGMELLKAADRVPSMFARHYPTWEFNPNEPRENFDEEFAKDPIGAMRDYGAVPPGSEYPLIHDEVRWRELAITPELRPTATFATYERVDPTGQRYVASRVSQARHAADQNVRMICFDAGQNFDAFAGACAHGEWIEEESGPRLITVFDWIIRMLPLPGTEVYFDSVREIIAALKPRATIGRVEFDRWNSVQLIQQIRALGIFAEQKSTSDREYIDFKVACFSGLVRLLPEASEDARHDPPVKSAAGAAIYELLGLQCDPDTHMVYNPNKGRRRGWDSNDVAQVVVKAHSMVQRQGFTDRHDDRSRRAARTRLEETGRDWASRGSIYRPIRGGAGRHFPSRGW